MNAVTANSDLRDITKAIRKEARAFAKTFGCTVSVTRKDYSAIRVTVVSSERNHICSEFRAWAVANPDGSAVSYQIENGKSRPVAQFTDWANELLTGLEAIASQYNWDKSDITTDYFHCNFYQFIRFDPSLTEDAKAERDAEREAAEVVEAVEAPATVANVVAVDFTSAQGNDTTEDKTDAEIESELAAIESELQAVKAERARLERMLIIASKKKQLDAERAKVAQLQELLGMA